jgi:hypothetical protein
MILHLQAARRVFQVLQRVANVSGFSFSFLHSLSHQFQLFGAYLIQVIIVVKSTGVI